MFKELTIQIKALDMFVTHGSQAIYTKTEIINSSDIDEKVKAYGIKVIEDINYNLTLN